MPKVTRSRKLVNSSLQLKLIVVFVSLASVAAMFQAVLFNGSITRLATAMTTDGQALSDALPGMLAWNLGLTLGLLVPGLLVVGLAVTHRIAGPIFVFERFLAQLARGERPDPVKLRQGDELQALCERLNEAVEALSAEKEERSDRRAG